MESRNEFRALERKLAKTETRSTVQFEIPQLQREGVPERPTMQKFPRITLQNQGGSNSLPPLEEPETKRGFGTMVGETALIFSGMALWVGFVNILASIGVGEFLIGVSALSSLAVTMGAMVLIHQKFFSKSNAKE